MRGPENQYHPFSKATDGNLEHWNYAYQVGAWDNAINGF
jgi:hypothetical protein